MSKARLDEPNNSILAAKVNVRYYPTDADTAVERILAGWGSLGKQYKLRQKTAEEEQPSKLEKRGHVPLLFHYMTNMSYPR